MTETKNQLNPDFTEVNLKNETGKPGFRDRTVMDEVNPEPVPWLLENWLAAKSVTLLAGPPARGKTTLALDVLSRLTRGRTWGPKYMGPPGGCHVLIYTDEDDLASTIVPALHESGADPKRVWEIVAQANGPEFHPAIHLKDLDETLAKNPDIRVVLIDPAMALLVGVRDEHRAGDVRAALQPIVELAKRRNVAVLCITHFLKRHKSSGSGALDRIIGSQAWGAGARLAWVAGRPGGQDEPVLAIAKGNVGPDKGGYRYLIVNRDQGDGINGRRIEFVERMEGTAEEVLAPKGVPREGPGRDLAAEWLIAWLSHEPDGAKWSDILEAGKAEGITKMTPKRARESLKSEGRLECVYGAGGRRSGRWKTV